METYAGDDLWEDLNTVQLTGLEYHAVLGTQAQAQAAPTSPNYLDDDDDDDDDDVDDFEEDDIEVINKRENQTLATQKPLPPVQTPTLVGQQRWNEQGRTTTPNKATTIPIRWQRQPGQAADGPSQTPAVLGIPRSQLAGNDDHDEAAKLRARLSELERDLYSARGEATMLRGKFDQMKADHNAELTRMAQASAEQTARQERAVEAARQAQRTAATELEFTRQDIREGVRADRKRDGAKVPKKNQIFVADGFDDLEVLSSPAKGPSQRRRDGGHAAGNKAERTPTKGKRKRPAFESPSLALETHVDDEVVETHVDHAALDTHADDAAMVVEHEAGALPFDRKLLHPLDARADGGEQFLKLALDHSSLHGQPLTFEGLAGYVFPKDATQSFASIIFQHLPRMGSADMPYSLPIDFARLLLELWARCLVEKYYEPIYDLAALLSFILHLQTTAVAPAIITELVRVVQDTCLVVAMPRFHSSDGRLPTHVEEELKGVDVAQALSLLNLAVLGVLCPSAGAAAGDSRHTRVWRDVQLEWLLVMLSPKQPQRELFGVLTLLRASVSPTSIGPVPIPGSVNHRTPETVAGAIIDRVSCHLAEPPPWSIAGPELRLAALQTLLAFASTPFGALQVASSDAAAPRVVTVLSWALDRLYDLDAPPAPWETPAAAHVDEEAMDVDTDGGVDVPTVRHGFSPTLDDDATLVNPAPLLCRLLAQAMLLLHRLMNDKHTAKTASLPARLVDHHGAFQRFLLALARLTFVADEDAVLEAGLDPGIIDLAHDLLDMTMTPDEADRIAECFIEEVA